MGLGNNFSFKLPEEFLEKISTGEYKRYGAIVKETAKGQVVGHLKEVGNLDLLNNFIPAPFNTIGRIFSEVMQYARHKEVMAALGVLQTNSYVAIGLGIASLIAIAFATKIILKRLKETEKKLFLKLDVINSNIDKIHYTRIKDLISELEAAFEIMQIVSKTENLERKALRLKDANHKFLELKKKFLKDFNEFDLENKKVIPTEQQLFYYNMFNLSCIGSYSTEFLIGDYDSIEENLKSILQDREGLSLPNYEGIYEHWWKERTKVISLDGIREINSGDHALQLKGIKDMITEDQLGFESLRSELIFLTENKINPQSYLNELRAMEPNIVLVCPNNN